MSTPAPTPSASSPAGKKKTARRAPQLDNHGQPHYRFLQPHDHLTSAFGNDWFALKAEAFARFFGTPGFLIAQTVFVIIWVLLNVTGVFTFDVYPFIFLNLAFSLQAAYAAPLILLAQTRQSDRDKVHADADARHRETIAQESARRQLVAAQQTEQLLELVKQNHELTRLTKELSQRIAELTGALHQKLVVCDETSPPLPKGI